MSWFYSYLYQDQKMREFLNQTLPTKINLWLVGNKVNIPVMDRNEMVGAIHI